MKLFLTSRFFFLVYVDIWLFSVLNGSLSSIEPV